MLMNNKHRRFIKSGIAVGLLGLFCMNLAAKRFQWDTDAEVARAVTYNVQDEVYKLILVSLMSAIAVYFVQRLDKKLKEDLWIVGFMIGILGGISGWIMNNFLVCSFLMAMWPLLIISIAKVSIRLEFLRTEIRLYLYYMLTMILSGIINIPYEMNAINLLYMLGAAWITEKCLISPKLKLTNKRMRQWILVALIVYWVIACPRVIEIIASCLEEIGTDANWISSKIVRMKVIVSESIGEINDVKLCNISRCIIPWLCLAYGVEMGVTGIVLVAMVCIFSFLLYEYCVLYDCREIAVIGGCLLLNTVVGALADIFACHTQAIGIFASKNFFDIVLWVAFLSVVGKIRLLDTKKESAVELSKAA